MADEMDKVYPAAGQKKGQPVGNWVERVVQRSRRGRALPGKVLMYFMIYAMFQMMFVQGWNDASQGPLLPLLQKYYQVDYVIISLIWISMAVGVIIAAFTNVYLADTLGFGLLVPLGATLQAISYVLTCWGGPFPLFVFAYSIAGLGIGWQDSQISSLAVRMPRATTITFLTHGMYGLGATVSPFVSTAFIQKVTERFYLYFTISLALAVISVVTLIVVFQGRTEDQIVGARLDQPIGEEEASPAVGTPPEDLGISGQSTPAEPKSERDRVPMTKPRASSAKLKAILVSPRAYYLAIYAFLYLGVEVTVAGWATTFLIQERGGDSSPGYVSAGFFGGLTLGRLILIPLTNWLGHRLSVFIYTIIAIALDLIIWFVPSLIGSAVCFALIGLAIGPMYPSCLMIITEIMPADLHTGTIGFMACIGVLGTALFPFITGAIASRHGVWVLQPLVVALLVASLGMWTLVARIRPSLSQ